MRFLPALLVLAAPPILHDEGAPSNRLEAEEAAAGWRLLFDGASSRGWVAWAGEEFPAAGWDVEDGCLHHTQAGGDLRTVETFGDFELAFEWKVAPGVNSGVKVRVPRREGAPIGPEYQVLDDAGTEEDANPLSSAAALYALYEPRQKELAPTGSFNRARIVCDGPRLEHWLNGVRVVAAEVGSPDWEARRARSKFRDVDGFAAGPGHVVLQDHGGEVWYRSIRIRDLGEPQAESLLPGPGLAGWIPVGAAEWRREGTDVVGSVGDGLPYNAFLRTEEHFTDFVFEVELLVEEKGNSGIQFRSHQRENGAVYGYQAEIDCSKRAWSGGIYDEGRRAWLANLKENEAGRAAFRVDEWNHYRIEARGERLRVWVNGVLTAELVDDADAEGFLALQVHGGTTGRFRWRAPRVRRL